MDSKEMVGKVFRRLTVIEPAKPHHSGRPQWLCQCECGNKSIVLQYRLSSGRTKSCGCLKKDRPSEIHKTHGFSKERLFKTWGKMVSRTTNPNDSSFHNYGGRGIDICDEWSNPETGFLSFRQWALSNGYQKNLTIDRVNNDKGYSPENCRWATVKEQNNNRRSTIHITYKGETKTATEWSLTLGGCKALVACRLQLGWNEQDAVSQPVGTRLASLRKRARENG